MNIIGATVTVYCTSRHRHIIQVGQSAAETTYVASDQEHGGSEYDTTIKKAVRKLLESLGCE